MPLKYSLVVPLKNEEENIEELVQEVQQVMDSFAKSCWELLCIDDGSTDQTLARLIKISKHSPFLKILSFERNYGQSAAFDAGFKHAQGDWIITLDGDRQNDPADIPKLLAVAEEYDLICGSRINRKDSWQKKAISKLANFVRSRFCRDQISDTGCSLKIYRSACLKNIKMFKGMHRFLPALFKIEGFRITEIPVNHRERLKGSTKYHFFNRSFNTVADMLAVRWMWKRHIHYRIKPVLKASEHDSINSSPFFSTFLFSGESSGDLHGAALVKALKERAPQLNLSGVAGPNMRQAGVVPFMHMEQFAVMGLSDVLTAFPKLIYAFYKIRNHIVKTNPDVVVLIDYPGFNLRLAKALRSAGYQGKLIQYISPSVWAWGKERVETMNRTLDLLLTIYPFEARYLFDSSLKVENHYVGNPLAEYVKGHIYDSNWLQKLNIPNSGRRIALFAGSRKGEVIRNLPVILEAAALYQKKYPEAQFILSSAHPETPQILERCRASALLKKALILVPQKYTYELMRSCRSAIAKSGSVTLELALHKCPSVVIYQLSLLNRLYAKFLLKLSLPHYCIVNLLAGREVFPELIEQKLNAQALFQQLEKVDRDEQFRAACIDACSHLIQELGNTQASVAAAELFLKK